MNSSFAVCLRVYDASTQTHGAAFGSVGAACRRPWSGVGVVRGPISPYDLGFKQEPRCKPKRVGLDIGQECVLCKAVDPRSTLSAILLLIMLLLLAGCNT